MPRTRAQLDECIQAAVKAAVKAEVKAAIEKYRDGQLKVSVDAEQDTTYLDESEFQPESDLEEQIQAGTATQEDLASRRSSDDCCIVKEHSTAPPSPSSGRHSAESQGTAQRVAKPNPVSDKHQRVANTSVHTDLNSDKSTMRKSIPHAPKAIGVHQPQVLQGPVTASYSTDDQGPAVQPKFPIKPKSRTGGQESSGGDVQLPAAAVNLNNDSQARSSNPCTTRPVIVGPDNDNGINVVPAASSAPRMHGSQLGGALSNATSRTSTTSGAGTRVPFLPPSYFQAPNGQSRRPLFSYGPPFSDAPLFSLGTAQRQAPGALPMIPQQGRVQLPCDLTRQNWGERVRQFRGLLSLPPLPPNHTPGLRIFDFRQNMNSTMILERPIEVVRNSYMLFSTAEVAGIATLQTTALRYQFSQCPWPPREIRANKRPDFGHLLFLLDVLAGPRRIFVTVIE